MVAAPRACFFELEPEKTKAVPEQHRKGKWDTTPKEVAGSLGHGRK